MDLQFGSDVRTVEGTKLGALQRVIYEPNAGRVPSLVVEHNAFDERLVLLPFGNIIDADTESIEIDLSESEFDALTDFAIDRNVAPPPDAIYAQDDIVKDPDIPDVPPVGAATGVESIAFTPLIEETQRVPVDDQVIDRSTIVYGTDGEIGKVKVVSLDDDTAALLSIVAEGGFFPVHEYEIAPGLIEAVRDESIVLTVARKQIKPLGED